jgi:predicted TPR repeat methyltransferase
MLDIARSKGRYRELHEAEIEAFLHRPETLAMGYDLVIAADVFVYVGRLDEVFARLREVLPAGGLLAFSVEHDEAGDYQLQPSSRYAHGERYIAELAQANGFERLPPQSAPVRQENKMDIPGRLELLRRS